MNTTFADDWKDRLPVLSEKVLCVGVSDLHLDDRAPRARSEEPSWYEAMAWPVRQLREIANHYAAPVVCGVEGV